MATDGAGPACSMGSSSAHWHRERKIPVPTAKDRRERITTRGRRLFDDGWEIKVIADALGYTPRGMKLLLEKSFRAEGRPDPALCERFLRLPGGHRSNAETADYDDVRSFTEIACSDWGAPEESRCFRGIRHEHEATNRYLLAFHSDCSSALVFRSCNTPLDTAPGLPE